ncbi:MAG: S41 family peptidase [Bacteroidota bacterium]|jgi:carboxyl-terminal processing protease
MENEQITSEGNTNPTQKNIRLPLILAFTLALGMFLGQKLPHYNQHFSLSGAHGSGNPLDEILKYVDAKYVDSVNTELLRREAIEHLLSKLDPHSVYISPDELKAVEEDMSGGFEGIGIEFLMVDDTMHVITPISGGPAESAGILAGDKVVSINDTAIAGVKIDNGTIFRKLRGKKGTSVKVGILRGKEKLPQYFNLTRAVIPVQSVDVAYMLDDKTGYIRVNRFTERTNQEFMEGLTNLAENRGLQHLVLDLRGNPGGYLEEATDILSQVFPEGKLLVYTQGRSENKREYKSNGRARFNIQQVAVLIDEGSASASEIVAGAIQDWDRGWVIGRRSYGKGLVQEQYPLSNGGGIRLTVARYYTPSGRCIQRDYKSDSDYEDDPERRLKNGELTDPSRIHQPDSTKYYTGQGRIVFGGGGITPDIFIPIDTVFASNSYQSVRVHIPAFVARWKEENAASLPADENQFVSDWKVTGDMLEALFALCEKEGVKRADIRSGKYNQELETDIKARIARIKYGDTALYKVLNSEDPAVGKALEMISSGTPVYKK